MTTTAEKFSTQFVGVIAQLLNDPEKAIAEHGLSRHQAMLAVAFYRAFEAVAFGRYSEIEQHLAQADEHFGALVAEQKAAKS